MIRWILHLRVGPVAIGSSVALGALFATLGGRWGFTGVLASWVVVSVLVAAIRRSAGPLRRNLSD